MSFMNFFTVILLLTTMSKGVGVVCSEEFKACYNSCYNKSMRIYPLFKKYGIKNDCLYKTSDSENELLKIKKQLYFNVNVRVLNGDTYAFVKIKNGGVKNVYIWRGSLGSYGDELSKDFFNIINNETRMDYQGVSVNFGSHPYTIDDYILIVPQGQINNKIKLNAYYDFMSGKHKYIIGTRSMPVLYEPVIGRGYAKEAFWVRSNNEEFSLGAY
ncbi:hypothetical protein [Cronobacter dublinensis]|uniref:hypothetical protein n=1 Tax=Cronobacter dublinensis TaxID=413497 RepID=UPI0024AE5943|nr:hypothetical protein [Cronobacter dublinensis]MDI6478643.1 hypothetical protein [Cronobacter dublinensis]